MDNGTGFDLDIPARLQLRPNSDPLTTRASKMGRNRSGSRWFIELTLRLADVDGQAVFRTTIETGEDSLIESMFA